MIKRYISNRQIAEDTDDTQDPIDPTDNTNTLGDVFQAIKRAILTVKEEENNDDSPPLFKTVAIDTGQFERVMSKVNTEYETAFPACFVRFTNVHFLVAQQRIGEGRGIIRIRFILNKLDNQHVNWETYPFYIAERLNKAIQDAKKVEEALQERCNLMYFDTPQSTNMLQAYWLDYEIYFKITSSYKYADWIKKKVITPPFTNHDDVPNDKPNVERPTYDESSTFNDLIVNAKSIQIMPNNNRLAVGEQMVLSVVFFPDNTTDKKITYESLNDSIATVNTNGVVTGIQPGMVKVAVETSNGIRAYCCVFKTRVMNKKTKQSSSWYSINKAPNTTNKENWYTIKPVSVQPMSARLVSVRNLEENEKSNEIIRHTDEFIDEAKIYNSITNVIVENQHLIITFSSGLTFDCGVVSGDYPILRSTEKGIEMKYNREPDSAFKVIVPSESIKINFDKLTQDQKEFLAINTCNYLIKNMTIDDNGHLIVNIQ